MPMSWRAWRPCRTPIPRWRRVSLPPSHRRRCTTDRGAVPRSLCIGLMSGTSIDAIDAVVCEFDDHGRPQALLGSYSKRYPDTLRQELLILQRQPDTPLTLRDLVRLDSAIGDCFAQTANILLQQVDIPADAIAAIGSHGQTLFHDPQTLGSSLQLGDPNRIAALTGICTIADFRRADMARSGQGAQIGRAHV